MVLKGGATGDLVLIIQALLEMKYIMFLPTTSIVIDQSKYNDYFASVDSKTLLYLVKEYDSDNIEAIQKIFGGPARENPPQIDNQGEKLMQNINIIKPDLTNMRDVRYYDKFLTLNNELQGLEGQIKNLKGEIDSANMQLKNFQCIEGLDNERNYFLSNFILDCSKYSNKDVDWFKVLLNIEKLDEDYETEVLKLVNKNGIQLEYDSIKDICNILVDNNELKTIFKDRLIECSKTPYSFIDTLTGSISFESLEDCQECHDDCILYLNDNYKSFLMNESDNIGITNKLKVLIYCEFRLYVLSKHLTLEALRIKKKNYSRVKNILKKLSYDQKKNIIQKNVMEKKRASDILKVEKLEAVQKKQKKEIDTLVDEKQKSMKGGGYGNHIGGNHHGGADINDNLMKQNLLSQVLQIIANDKSLNAQNVNMPDIQNKLNMIKDPNMMPKDPNKDPNNMMPKDPNKDPNNMMPKDPNKDPNNMMPKDPNKDPNNMMPNNMMPNNMMPNNMMPNNIVNVDENKKIADELVPNCTAIAKDIMDGKINEKNFIYLSPKCDKQILNALKSS